MVNELLVDVRSRLRSLAQERQWDSVIATLASADGADADLLIVAAPNVDVAPLRVWLSATHPGVAIGTSAIREISPTPEALLHGNRVIGLAECGSVWTPETVDVFSELISVRPVGSYAFVLGKADQIESMDDIALVE